MHLIEYENYQIKPSPEALLIKPIRDLFNQDKTKNKEKFYQQMSIIYFFADPRSTYSYITDDESRLQEILKQEGLPLEYTVTGKLEEAINVYKKHMITTSQLLLQDTKLTIDKLRSFLRNIDLDERDERGKAIYTINSITQAIKQIPQLAKDIMEAEKIVAKEIEEQGRARGGNNKTLFDDGFNL